MTSFCQTRFGREIIMSSPKAEDVDFEEICLQLADLNRFAGATRIPISVAFHSLICFELAKNDPDPLLPAYMLIHDCHEQRVGEITRPAALGIADVAHELFGVPAAGIVKDAIRELKHRHDLVIWYAAGLPEPTPEQEKRIKHYDNRALMTEARDFGVEPKSSWEVFGINGIEPSERIYSDGYFGWNRELVAAKLYARMQMAFPSLFNALMGVVVKDLGLDRLAA
jgi:hypothetical protein